LAAVVAAVQEQQVQQELQRLVVTEVLEFQVLFLVLLHFMLAAVVVEQFQHTRLALAEQVVAVLVVIQAQALLQQLILAAVAVVAETLTAVVATAEMAALVLLSFLMLEHNEAQAAQLHQAVETLSTHSLLAVHLQLN
jgi:hypothetical protein